MHHKLHKHKHWLNALMFESLSVAYLCYLCSISTLKLLVPPRLPLLFYPSPYIVH